MTQFERRTVLSALAALPMAGMVSGKVSAESEMKDVALKKAPKFRGVVYDVGLNFSGTGFSVEPFDPALVEYDIKAISKSLHANAIRIEGEAIDRLVTASRIAHKQGLSVFFNPWKMNADATELVPYYTEAAKAAEALRKDGVDIVFVAGCEYPIFQKGLLPGDTLADRLAGLGTFFADGMEAVKSPSNPLWIDLNKHLKTFAEAVRSEFKGPVTYAATAFEQVDWSIFDIVGVDHYRGEETAEQYDRHFDEYKVNKRPVVCMEVGSCTYVGAAKLGGGGFMVLEGTNPDGSGKFKGGVIPTRSEREQADYVETQVKLLANNDAAGIFIYVFSFPLYTHDKGAKDLDLVSYALVKTYPKHDPRSKAMPPWAPKESFHRLAGLFEQMKQLPA